MIVVRLLLVCLIANLWSPPVFGTPTAPAVPLPADAPLYQAQEFYQIYRTAAQMISSDIVQRVDIDTTEGIARTAATIAAEAGIVSRLKLANDSSTSAGCNDERFDMFVLPQVFRYRTKYDAPATTPTLEHFFRINASHYPRHEWVVAQEIFVKSDDWGAETTTVLRRLAQQLETEPFPQVAFLYNESVGVKSDGRLGRVRRGQVPDWKFDLLLGAVDDGTFFGPVAVEGGWYFASVADRFTTATDAFAFYRSQVEQDYRRIFAREHLRKALAESEQSMNPVVRAYDASDPAGPGQLAYSVAGTSLTFEQCHERLPFLLGDKQSTRFWDSVCSQTLQNHLLFLREDAKALVGSPEHRYLSQALRNTCLVEHYLEQQLAGLVGDESALREFYSRRADKPAYVQPDMVRTLVARMPATSGVAGHVDRELMTRVRDAFAASPTTPTLERLQHDAPAIVSRVDHVPQPIDRLGRVMEMRIGNEGAGFLTPVFMGQDGAYYFTRVISREVGKPKPFEEVREQLKAELREERKQSLLDGLYGADR